MIAELLEGFTCIVTGGGRGIGRATAEALAARGASVAICARTLSELEETAQVIESTVGRRCLTASLDVTDRSAAHRFAAKVAKELGPPRLLINNAAMVGPVGRINEIDVEQWQRALAVNVGGVATMCAAVVPTMTSGGAIVNLSGAGIGGVRLAPFVSAYSASKAAVAVLTETLAGELSPAGVTVNAIAPGPVATGFLGPVIEAGPERAGELYEAALAQKEASAALEPFFALVCYLASPEGRWITGRLLSARWDRIEDFVAAREAITGGSLFTLRRIDGTQFVESST